MRTDTNLMFGLVLGLSLSGCFASKKNQESLPVQNSEAIIGGTESPSEDDFRKSIVAVYDANEGGLCTGTLVGNNLVVTAAHCIGSDIDQMFVYFGSVLTEDSAGYQVDKVEVSPYWKSNQGQQKDQGDIAVLHFIGKPPKGVAAATWITPNQQRLLLPNTEIIVAGYGISDGITGDGAGVLRQTTLKISDPSFSQSEVLIDQSTGTSVCHGDSGGPAFLHIDGQYYFWGVVSRGIEDLDNTCATFSAFTKVTFYKIWLDRMLSKLSTSLTNLSH